MALCHTLRAIHHTPYPIVLYTNYTNYTNYTIHFFSVSTFKDGFWVESGGGLFYEHVGNFFEEDDDSRWSVVVLRRRPHLQNKSHQDSLYRAVLKKCPGERHTVEPRGFF